MMQKVIMLAAAFTLSLTNINAQGLEITSGTENIGNFQIRVESNLQPECDEESTVYISKNILPNGDYIESLIYRQNGIWNMWKTHFGKYGEDLGVYRIMEVNSDKNPPCEGKWELFPKGQSTSNGQSKVLKIKVTNGANCSKNSNISLNSIILNTSGVAIPFINNEELSKLDNPYVGLKIWHKEGGCVKVFDGEKWNCN